MPERSRRRGRRTEGEEGRKGQLVPKRGELELELEIRKDQRGTNDTGGKSGSENQNIQASQL